MLRLLSTLAHWCPIFAEVQYIPGIVWPFVKTIPNDDLVLFEVVMSFFLQFCQLWFEPYPSDPAHVLQTSVEIIIYKEAPKLYAHLKQHAFTVTQYAWPFL